MRLAYLIQSYGLTTAKIGTMTLIQISRCMLSAREDGQYGRHRSSIYLNLSVRETIGIL
jgi:hypothetical protein